MNWLWRELAPFPGRTVATCRIVIAAVLVVIISMTLEVPEAALSVFLVLFVSRQNKTATILTGVLLSLGATIAIGAVIWLLPFVVDRPEWRVPALALLLLAGMYFSRVFIIGPLAFAVGFVMAMALAVVGTRPGSGELIVRALLWLLVSVLYPIALTVVASLVFQPVHPHEEIAARLHHRLEAVRGAIRRRLGLASEDPDAVTALRDVATRGTGSLAGLIRLAGKGEAAARQSGLIAATNQAGIAAAALELENTGSLLPQDRAVLVALDAAFAAPEKAPDGDISPASDPRIQLLREAEKTWFAPSFPPAPGPKAKKHLLAPDAFTNLDHFRFAVKVTAAAMICYIIYTALDWSGIQTAFITSCFCALESSGATLRKMTLRIVGCLMGAALGVFSILFLVPHMEGIVSLALLMATGMAAAAWIALGSEKIAYAGIQLGFAFAICILQGFAPGTDLESIRDRIAGILLGIVVTSLVFRYLWPERAADRLRAALARLLRRLAKFVEAAPEITLAEMTKDFDNVLRLSSQAAFELDLRHRDEVAKKAHLAGLIIWAQRAFLAVATSVPLAEFRDRSTLASNMETEAEKLRRHESDSP